MKFKIGDKVRIVSKESMMELGNNSEEMLNLSGKIAKITELMPHGNYYGNDYQIDLDKGKYCWREEKFLPLSNSSVYDLGFMPYDPYK